jgi:hypothetical protein
MGMSTADRARPDAPAIIRHWNVIADTLHSDDVYLPLLFEDEEGISRANDWASGFLRGMDLRRDEWADLSGDGQRGGLLVPIFALAHEHDPDPTMRPYNESITCVDAKARLASVLLLSGRAATAMSNGRQNRPIPAHHCREIGRLIARQEQENVEIGFHSLPAALVYGFRWRDQGANAGGAHHYRNCQSFYG